MGWIAPCDNVSMSRAGNSRQRKDSDDLAILKVREAQEKQ